MVSVAKAVAGEITPNEAAEIAKLIGDCVKAYQTAWWRSQSFRRPPDGATVAEG